MSHPSTRSIDEIRRELLASAEQLASRVRKWAWWRGLALWAGTVLVTMVLLLVLDFIWRREELGLRALSLAALLVTAIWAAMRFLLPVWRLSPTPLQLAQWIEKNRPDLGERLSTAVQIAETSSSEVRFGSQGFREAVLRAWETESHKPSWSDYLDTSSAWRSIALTASVTLCIIVGFTARPSESRQAFTRLIAPWSADAWPRRDQLEFRDFPQVMGVGSELQLEVIDRNGPLPDNVLIQLREIDQSSQSILNIPTKQLDQVAIGNLPPLESAVEVRATGGDDDTMPWQKIEIVTPPTLENYLFEIEPPTYTARPTTELVGTRIQILSGSRVRFSAKFDAPIRELRLSLSNELAASSETAQPEWVPILSSDSQSFVIAAKDSQPSALTQTITWQLEVLTRDGLRIEQPQRWRIEVIDDAPPTVALEAPAMNQTAANGLIALNGQATDDLGLASITGRLQVEGDESREPLSHLIWSNPGDTTQDIAVRTDWDLATALSSENRELSEGQVISVWLEARDHLGQLGRSQTERFEIQSPEKLLAKIQDRQSDLRERMRELLDAQRRNQQLTHRTEQAIRESKQVAQTEVDALAGIAQNQRALSEQLAGQRDSLREQVAESESALEMNRLEASPLAEQMRALKASLTEIADREMQQAVEASAAALRETQSEASSKGEVKPAILDRLAISSQSQTQVVDTLQALTDRLNRSGGFQQVQRELAMIANQQISLLRDTETLQLELLRSNRPETLTDAQQAISDEQLSLAQQLDALLNRARELSSNVTHGEQERVVEQISQAVETITQGQASRRMRRAAELIDVQQLSEAIESEREASQVLSTALRQLDPTRSSTRSLDLGKLAEQLQAASDSLTQLANSQAQLADQMRQPDATEQASQLSAQQAAIGELTEQQATASQTAGDQQAANSMRSVVEEQNVAAKAANEQQMQAAATAAEKAAAQLQSLAENFQQRADELVRQSQQQQMVRLEVAIVELIELQTPVVDQLNRIAEQSLANNELPNEAAARQAAVDQEAVRLSLQNTREQAQQLSTFDWLLEQIAADMARAVAATQRYRIDPEALTAANDALRKLELANEALNQQDENLPEAEETDDTNQPGDTDTNQQTALPPVASLKLLRGLQQELNQQTLLLNQEADQARRNRRLRELSDQQQSLGTQLEALLKSVPIESSAPNVDTPL